MDQIGLGALKKYVSIQKRDKAGISSALFLFLAPSFDGQNVHAYWNAIAYVPDSSVCTYAFDILRKYFWNASKNKSAS